MIAVQPAIAMAIADLPAQLRRALFDEAYDSAFNAHDYSEESKVMALEAAVNSILKKCNPARHVPQLVNISTGETLQIEYVGKFIMVEW